MFVSAAKTLVQENYGSIIYFVPLFRKNLIFLVTEFQKSVNNETSQYKSCGDKSVMCTYISPQRKAKMSISMN